MLINEAIDYIRSKYAYSCNLDIQKNLYLVCDKKTKKWIIYFMTFFDQETNMQKAYCHLLLDELGLNLSLQQAIKDAKVESVGKFLSLDMNKINDIQILFQLIDQVFYTYDHHIITLEDHVEGSTYHETPITKKEVRRQKRILASNPQMPKLNKEEEMPAKLKEMYSLVMHNGYYDRIPNFLKQGKFMAEYEDNYPWVDDYKNYYPCYHDIPPEILRGYFSWRKKTREGEYHPIATSLSYLYVYELLNGIGCKDVEERFDKLEEFLERFVKTIAHDERMADIVEYWIFDLALDMHFPIERAKAYFPDRLLKLDRNLMTLKKVKDHTSLEIFQSLMAFSDRSFYKSPVYKKEPEKTKEIAGMIIKNAFVDYRIKKKTLFSFIFKGQRSKDYFPLYNALYERNKEGEVLTYDIDPIRIYHLNQYNNWSIKAFQINKFDYKFLKGFIREIDRFLRAYLEIGRKLKVDDAFDFMEPYEEKAIKEYEEKHKLMDINLASLQKIRYEAALTRESLLTEEEKEVEQQPVVEEEKDVQDHMTEVIIKKLLKNEDVTSFLQDHHLFMEVVADEINEAYYDEIGDNIVEIEDNKLVFIEDYREDIEELLYGRK